MGPVLTLCGSGWHSGPRLTVGSANGTAGEVRSPLSPGPPPGATPQGGTVGICGDILVALPVSPSFVAGPRSGEGPSTCILPLPRPPFQTVTATTTNRSIGKGTGNLIRALLVDLPSQPAPTSSLHRRRELSSIICIPSTNTAGHVSYLPHRHLPLASPVPRPRTRSLLDSSRSPC